jgi:HSP20 family protein
MAPPSWPELAEFSPAFDVSETRDAYVFKADVPGVKEGDLDVTVTGSRLTVTGKRDEEKEEKTERQYTYERSYGSFTRSFTLPEGVDTANTHADLRDGVLTLTVRKSQEAQSKKVQIQTQAKKS